MATDLQATLQALTAQPTTEQPYLSIYLDWTPDGNGRRPSLQILEQELDLIAERLRGQHDALATFNVDRERIMAYLNDEAPVDARGLAIFACDAESIWEALALQVPVETRIVADHYPHTFNLARIIDDYETYAIVLTDSQESRILVISLNEAEQAGRTAASEEIKRFEAGGWAQMIFQRRTENIIKAHTKEIADRLSRIIKRYDVQHVIIAGNESIKGIVRSTLPKEITDKLVDFISLDITTNLASIMEVIEPMMRQVEQEQEADDVAALEEQVESQNLGVAGVSDTAMALSKGQVRTLIMHQSFNSAGRQCPTCGMLFAGLRSKCVYDGAELEAVDLREMFVSRAMQQGAGIQIVEDGPYLDSHEGVGALLRYRDTGTQARAV